MTHVKENQQIIDLAEENIRRLEKTLMQEGHHPNYRKNCKHMIAMYESDIQWAENLIEAEQAGKTILVECTA